MRRFVATFAVGDRHTTYEATFEADDIDHALEQAIDHANSTNEEWVIAISEGQAERRQLLHRILAYLPDNSTIEGDVRAALGYIGDDEMMDGELADSKGRPNMTHPSSGSVARDAQDRQDAIDNGVYRDCPACRGTGGLGAYNECAVCDGTGVVS